MNSLYHSSHLHRLTATRDMEGGRSKSVKSIKDGDIDVSAQRLCSSSPHQPVVREGMRED